MPDMNWIVWLGVASGIASIVSLIFTIIQARRAKRSAREAVKAKESIMRNQSTLELKAMLDVAGEIERHLIKRTSPNIGSNQGHNVHKEHSLIENFISKLNEIISRHSEDCAITTLTVEYQFFLQANGSDPKPYKEMLEHVRIVISVINKVVKNNIYS